MERGNPENMIQSLSGKVSTEALSALETLMAKHKTEMDAMKNNTTGDQTARKTQMETFKAEMDALIVKYPELKTALPLGKMGEGRGQMEDRGNNAMETALSSLPTDAQTEIKTIRENSRTKMEAIRNEEETAIEAVITKYPEVKTQYDEVKKNRPTGERGPHEFTPPDEVSTSTDA